MSEWTVTTPIDTFEHPETGSVVDLVSVVHIGKPGYYRKLGSYVMGRQDEGFTVQYEMIACTDEEEPSQGPGIVDRVKKRLMGACEDASVDWMVELESSSSYINQSNDDLFRPEGSFNVDIDESEVSSRLGLFSHIAMLREARKMRGKLSRAAKKGSESFDEFIFNKLRKNISGAEAGKPIRTKRDKLIIDRRNEIALAGVDSALQDDSAAKLVLIWGIGHFAGLSSGLIELGYSRIERQDVQVAFNMTGIERSIEKNRQSAKSYRAKADRYVAASRIGGIRGLLISLGLKDVPDERCTFTTSGISQDFSKQMEKDREKWRKDFERSREEDKRRTEKMLEDTRKQREKAMKQIEADRKARARELQKDLGRNRSGWFNY